MYKLHKNSTVKRIVFICAAILCFSTAFPVLQVSAETSDAPDLSKFPKSYHEGLNALHKKYPEWVFIPVKTGLEWNDVIAEESSKNRSLVPAYWSDMIKSKEAGDYNPASNTFVQRDNGWVNASKSAVSYFVNPVNFLDESRIFQFESLSYNADSHTAEGVEAILKGSFMYKKQISYTDAKGNTVNTDKTYSEVIIEAAQSTKVSAYYLASKIRQEVGAPNPGGSVSGKHGNYPGIYNFFNIGAYDSMDSVSNGLSWASSDHTYRRPWDSPYKAIMGGAEYIAQHYVSEEQSTGYFQRFDVNRAKASMLYKNQYMTNVAGAASEGITTYEAHKTSGSMAKKKTFYIPVYENMPESSAQVKLNTTVNSKGIANTEGSVLREGAGESYASLGIKISKNTEVTILESCWPSEVFSDSMMRRCPYWYKIRVTVSNKEYTGYIPADLVDSASAVTLKKDESLSLSCTVYAAGTDTSKPLKETVYFESANTNICTVDSSGKLSARSAGTALIRVFTSGGGMDTLTVTVTASSGSAAPSNPEIPAVPSNPEIPANTDIPKSPTIPSNPKTPAVPEISTIQDNPADTDAKSGTSESPAVYLVISNFTLVKDAEKETSIVINADYETNYGKGDGSSVWLNGKQLVRGKDYTDAGSNSVIITLLPACLKTLPNGSYGLEVRFADGGTASGTLAVNIQTVQAQSAAQPAAQPAAPSSDQISPATGDSTAPSMWLIVMISAVLILLGSFLVHRSGSKSTD